MTDLRKFDVALRMIKSIQQGGFEHQRGIAYSGDSRKMGAEMIELFLPKPEAFMSAEEITAIKEAFFPNQKWAFNKENLVAMVAGLTVGDGKNTYDLEELMTQAMALHAYEVGKQNPEALVTFNVSPRLAKKFRLMMDMDGFGNVLMEVTEGEGRDTVVFDERMIADDVKPNEVIHGRPAFSKFDILDLKKIGEKDGPAAINQALAAHMAQSHWGVVIERDMGRDPKYKKDETTQRDVLVEGGLLAQVMESGPVDLAVALHKQPNKHLVFQSFAEAPEGTKGNGVGMPKRDELAQVKAKAQRNVGTFCQEMAIVSDTVRRHTLNKPAEVSWGLGDDIEPRPAGTDVVTFYSRTDDEARIADLQK